MGGAIANDRLFSAVAPSAWRPATVEALPGDAKQNGANDCGGPGGNQYGHGHYEGVVNRAEDVTAGHAVEGDR